MKPHRPAFVVFVVVTLAAGIYASRSRFESEAAIRQCVEIYASSLPSGSRIGHARQSGQDLFVEVLHRDWTGEFRCALYRNGSVDEVETLSRKIEVLWSEPPVPTTP